MSDWGAKVYFPVSTPVVASLMWLERRPLLPFHRWNPAPLRRKVLGHEHLADGANVHRRISDLFGIGL